MTIDSSSRVVCRESSQQCKPDVPISAKLRPAREHAGDQLSADRENHGSMAFGMSDGPGASNVSPNYLVQSARPRPTACAPACPIKWRLSHSPFGFCPDTAVMTLDGRMADNHSLPHIRIPTVCESVSSAPIREENAASTHLLVTMW